ncbi:light-mediated development protein DET1 isoform X2 [Punica granatum]|uniref:Light-mediated development protein DET1 isoform X2 n=1 Tax=Punica granatum TaxID=22663 RepID=A0A6P8DB00_PUNGR|nr:light-mediated development protein DET1 isoform X2 [Punica granatum]
MFRSSNVAARVFERQIRTPPPGTSVHSAREFYENLVPSHTIYDIECPDHFFRKFTDDGQFLISFSRNQQELIVYRPRWLSFSCREEDCNHDLPPKARRFDSFFTQQSCVSLASSNELIFKDFFLYMESNQFGIFTSTTPPIHDAPAFEGAIPGVPLVEKITFYLIRLENGDILDKKVFHNDFVNLSHNMGVFLYDNLLAIVSLRFQTIHILQIRESGNLVDVRAIGLFCREDDELFLNSNAQLSGDRADAGLHHRQSLDSTFLSGLKQRLLSFVFRGIWHEESDDTLRIHSLKKKFFFHFQDYVDLIIWKVQFLDRHHLLIKFGSVDGWLSRNADHHPAFFAVYNMETTEIVAFYQNSSEELYQFFEQFCDHFHVASGTPLYMRFISSQSNNIHALEQLKSIKAKANSFPQLISATDRNRLSTDHPIKFITRRRPCTLKFKIKPGPEAGNADTRTKRISFLFHPFLPLALSIQQTPYLQPSVNIHFRR